MRYEFTVGAAHAALRLDRYLAQRLPSSCSRAVVQRAIKDGQVTVGGAAAKAHRKLKSGERIVARLTENRPADPDAVTPEPIPLAIVHEDADVLVVNKPPDLVTHPAPGHPTGTLVNAVAWHLRRHAGPLLPRAGIVHRLDKDTSGLLVIAKTDTALRELSKQLRARTMGRRYIAAVEGHMPQEEGTIDVGVGRHLTHRTEMAVRYLGGRRAVTHYRVRERRATPDGALRYTVVDVQLDTGRTHQIRVHVAHLGHPVLGDVTYSRHPAEFWKAHGIHRQLLHAYAIRFAHPSTGKPMELRADVPEDMMPWTGRIPS